MTEVINENQINAWFTDVMMESVRDADYTPEMRQVTVTAEKRAQDAFQRQQTVGGDPWPQWAVSPVPPWDRTTPTLEVSGKLRSSLLRGGTHNHYMVDRNKAEFGTLLSYARNHFFGEPADRERTLWTRDGAIVKEDQINIVARPFLGLLSHDVEGLADAVANRTVQAMKKG